jgi:hypothetical protein
MTTFARRVALLFTMVSAVVAQPLWAQETKPAPVPPAPASETKPARLEFDVPATLIGPGLDSVRRQISPTRSLAPDSSAPAKNVVPPANELPQPSKPAAPDSPGRQELVPARSFPAAPPVPQEMPAPLRSYPAAPPVPQELPAPRSLPPAASALQETAPQRSFPPPSAIQELPPPARETAPSANELPLGSREVKSLSKPEIIAAVSDRFTAYFLRSNPRTLVLDFPTIRDQARMFGRVILFVERGGAPKTKVLTVPEAQKWLAQNSEKLESLTMGNNFRAGELARFFNTARFQGEPLTVDETRLYNWLLETQVLRDEELGVSVVQPELILISFPQTSSVPGCAACGVTPALRAVVLEHELAHARFATDTAYQNYVMWYWSQAMNVVARTKFTQFLRKRGYDTNIPELLANEMQAFLIHTPDAAVFGAAQLGMTEPELNDLRESFRAGLFPKAPVVAQKPYQFE